MYLARLVINDTPRYHLRESLFQDGSWAHRTLADLGPDPGRLIQYQGGFGYQLDETLLNLLQDQGVVDGWEQLDEALYPFLDPYLQARLQPFRQRVVNRRWVPMDRTTRERAITETHLFDRRRLYFLRFGHYDGQRLNRCQPVYRTLLDCSRDEIEQRIQVEEAKLKAREMRSYLFAAFDIRARLDGAGPEKAGFSLEQLDQAFLQTLCQLNGDDALWAGFPRTEVLPRYLRRYLFFWFDLVLTHQDPAKAFFGFAGHGRQQRPRPMPTTGMAIQEALAIFGLDQRSYDDMDRPQLRRLYRSKAKELHPDRGGSHERFIALARAYGLLIRYRT
jgi:hypothetical protein